MSLTVDALAQEALVLTAEQRLALAYRLLVSVEPAADAGAEAAWDVEISKRIARYDSGESTPVPAEDVFARLRQIAP